MTQWIELGGGRAPLLVMQEELQVGLREELAPRYWMVGLFLRHNKSSTTTTRSFCRVFTVNIRWDWRLWHN